MGHSTSSGKNGTHKQRKLTDKEYRYHGTNLRNALSIAESELKPSDHGLSGTGVYFAYNEDDAKMWALEQSGGNVILRVRGDKLNDKGYADIDDDEGTAQKPIPASDIEVKVFDRKKKTYGWKPLKKWAAEVNSWRK